MKSLLAAALLALKISTGPVLVQGHTLKTFADLADYAQENLSDTFKPNTQIKDALNKVAESSCQKLANETRDLLETHMRFLAKMRAEAISYELSAQKQVSQHCSDSDRALWVQLTGQTRKKTLSGRNKGPLPQYESTLCPSNLQSIDSARMYYSVVADDTRVSKKIKAALDKLSKQCT